MKLTRAVLVVIVLLLGGCQMIDTHPRVESLSKGEIRYVLDKFKVYMLQLGMAQTSRAANGNPPDYARFEITGASFKEYLDLSYFPETGFTLKITRITIQSLNLTDKDIADIKLRTEQMISEATSKNVQLRVFVELP